MAKYLRTTQLVEKIHITFIKPTRIDQRHCFLRIKVLKKIQKIFSKKLKKKKFIKEKINSRVS